MMSSRDSDCLRLRTVSMGKSQAANRADLVTCKDSSTCSKNRCPNRRFSNASIHSRQIPIAQPLRADRERDFLVDFGLQPPGFWPKIEFLDRFSSCSDSSFVQRTKQSKRSSVHVLPALAEKLSRATQTFEAIKHLIVGSNVLLFVSKEGLRVFPLSQYVIERDPMGNVLEIIT